MEEDIKIINLGFVNAFLVRISEGFALIDTGLSKDWETLENRLISEGALPDKLKIVILTHGDRDHIGNAKTLQDKYGVKIGIHKEDYEVIKTGVHPKRKVRPLGFRIMFVFFNLIRKIKKSKDNKNLFNPLFLSDGESLEEFGYDAKVIHIPGHTKGSIGILIKNKDFFAGDTFVNRKRPETAQIIENNEELKNSIEKIKKLDINIIYPGHGKPFFRSDIKL